MSDEPKKRTRAWIWWAAVALLLLAYPLSAGPVGRCVLKSSNPQAKWQTLRTVYAPIFWLRRHSGSAQPVIDWYLLRFWDS
ncbi:MAG TPA: hypothetical protein VG055_22435 [Planctomycetaceae bacterium]|nr:hypothetical protein [Planctomycetaceae bacterium]